MFLPPAGKFDTRLEGLGDGAAAPRRTASAAGLLARALTALRSCRVSALLPATGGRRQRRRFRRGAAIVRAGQLQFAWRQRRTCHVEAAVLSPWRASDDNKSS